LHKRKANEDDAVGRVLGYTIIVTEDYTKNTEGDAFLPGWRDVQKFSVWPPYQVSHKVFPLGQFYGSGFIEFRSRSEDSEPGFSCKKNI
jgi:receptor-type tyrosine-protein phosphatase beta